MNLKQFLTKAEYLSMGARVNQKFNIDITSNMTNNWSFGFMFRKQNVKRNETVSVTRSGSAGVVLFFDITDNYSMLNYMSFTA